MYKVGEYVVYRKDVCLVKRIKDARDGTKYYVLSPLRDHSLIINVPIKNTHGLIRKLMTKDEVMKLIEEIPTIPTIDINDRTLENEYRTLLDSNEPKNLIRIIKTTYLRNKDRLDHNKKIAEKDNEYFNKSEEYLYYEFGCVLGMSFEEAKKYVIDRVTALSNQ